MQEQHIFRIHGCNLMRATSRICMNVIFSSNLVDVNYELKLDCIKIKVLRRPVISDFHQDRTLLYIIFENS